VLGDRAVFRNNDVTNVNTEICFILGSHARGHAAEGTVLDVIASTIAGSVRRRTASTASTSNMRETRESRTTRSTTAPTVEFGSIQTPTGR
jgi:hypothetical protein